MGPSPLIHSERLSYVTQPKWIMLYHDRYLNVHVQYEVKLTDLNSLSAVSIPEVKSLVKHARALKRKLNKHDKSLFSANGLHLRSPRLEFIMNLIKKQWRRRKRKKKNSSTCYSHWCKNCLKLNKCLIHTIKEQ